jgi:hypothetical protein
MLTSSPVGMIAFNVLDITVNLSDHLPVLAVCSADLSSVPPDTVTTPAHEVYHLRWDHAPLDAYYEHTRLGLKSVLDELNMLDDNLSFLQESSITNMVDRLYENVVSVLQNSCKLLIPKRSTNFL